MKKVFLFLIFMLLICMVSFSYAMIATTDDGRKVVLNGNGTWEWLNGPSPVNPTAAGINGKWNFSFKLGIFQENFNADIYQFSDGLTITWHGTFGDDTINVKMISKTEFQFKAKSFHNGEVTFKARIESGNKISGMVSSSGAFPETGSFTAVRK